MNIYKWIRGFLTPPRVRKSERIIKVLNSQGKWVVASKSFTDLVIKTEEALNRKSNVTKTNKS